MYRLHIGDKSYSSWSLRGWLLLEAFGLPFEEAFHPMYTPDFEAFKRQAAPALKVPTLEISEHGETRYVWDSLAIAETLAERHPDAGHWPERAAAREAARSLTAEAHSSFAPLRNAMTLNLRRRYPGVGHSEQALADAGRIQSLWAWARARFGQGGPWLFGGRFTAADAFYAPYVTRFETYGVPTTPEARAYMDAVLNHPSVTAWIKGAMNEPWFHARYEPVPESAFADWAQPRAPRSAKPWRGDVKARVNMACPFSGKPVKADSLAEADGVVIGFCNPDCRDSFVADPLGDLRAMRLIVGHR